MNLRAPHKALLIYAEEYSRPLKRMDYVLSAISEIPHRGVQHSFDRTEQRKHNEVDLYHIYIY